MGVRIKPMYATLSIHLVQPMARWRKRKIGCLFRWNVDSKIASWNRVLELERHTHLMFALR